MSRSGYSEDLDMWDLIRYRGQVASAIRGKRGQAFLRDLLTELDAMPAKRLVKNEFETAGDFCTLGVIGHARGIDMSKIDPDDSDHQDDLAQQFNISKVLVAEIEWENDDYSDAPESRWKRMREWIAGKIK